MRCHFYIFPTMFNWQHLKLKLEKLQKALGFLASEFLERTRKALQSILFIDTTLASAALLPSTLAATLGAQVEQTEFHENPKEVPEAFVVIQVFHKFLIQIYRSTTNPTITHTNNLHVLHSLNSRQTYCRKHPKTLLLFT